MTRDDRIKFGRMLLGIGLFMIAAFDADIIPSWFRITLAFWGGLAIGIFL